MGDVEPTMHAAGSRERCTVTVRIAPTLIVRAAHGLALVEFDRRDNQVLIKDTAALSGMFYRQPMSRRSRQDPLNCHRSGRSMPARSLWRIWKAAS
jgi:hypothetical protein